MNILKIADIACCIAGGFFRRKEIPVIYYHSIVKRDGGSYQETNIDVFKRHMNFLTENGYKTLLFSEYDEESAKHNEEKRILIAFDDGYRNNYDAIYDFMGALRLKYNIFLTGDKIDVDENYLTWDAVKTMYNSGLVDFGAHTYTHIDSREINKDNLDLEINKTNELIRTRLGKEIEDFCFPYGYYDEKTLEFFAGNTNYRHLFTSDYMPSKIVGNTKVIGRIPIRNEDTVKIFGHKVKMLYDCLYYVRYKNKHG